ncbi:MAG: ABC transporter substrate-binding protein, partial [Synechococcus sp. MOX_bin13]|nr:ABC transporter substrate-binding protein [Synechococcus sp. MOX_bin13]
LQSWVEQGWRDPLRRRLVQQGWRAPIASSGAMVDQTALSARLRPLLFPSSDTWSRCWSLPPLLPEDRRALEERWRDSAPEPPSR